MNRQEQGLHAVAAGDDGGSGSRRRPEDVKKQDQRGQKDPEEQRGGKDRARISENPIDVEPKDPNPPASPSGG